MRFAAGIAALAALAAAAAATAAPPRVVRAGTPVRSALHFPADLSPYWGGFAVDAPDGGSVAFTSAVGTWTQPAVTCASGDDQSALALWVGLGGFADASPAVEQIGTDADCSSSGPPSYYAWYELYPLPPVSFAMKIEPGDVLTASVAVSNTSVVLELRNRTRGTLAMDRALVASPDVSSAEWIVEAPNACGSGNCGALPLANFHTAAFSKIAVSAGGHTGTLIDPAWQAWPNYVDNGASTAGTCVAQLLDSTGDAFSIAFAPSPTAGTC